MLRNLLGTSEGGVELVPMVFNGTGSASDFRLVLGDFFTMLQGAWLLSWISEVLQRLHSIAALLATEEIEVTALVRL